MSDKPTSNNVAFSSVLLGAVNKEMSDARIQPVGVARYYIEQSWELTEPEREATMAAVAELKRAKNRVAVLNYWNALTHMSELQPPAEVKKARDLVDETMEAVDHADYDVIQNLVKICNKAPFSR